MIGSLNPENKQVTIIGAGISGLLIGYALKKKGYQVRIHEQSNRCGGLIETKHTPYGIAETAAHSIQVNESVESFLKEVGVELLPVRKESTARWIYRNGKMRRMPLGFLEILNTLFHFFKKPKLNKPLDQLNLEEWGIAYLGKPATRYLLSPFTAGIFACSPSELNVKLSFPKLLPESEKSSLFKHLLKLKSKSGSKTKRPRMMVFKYGTEDLIRKLSELLKNEIQLNSKILSTQVTHENCVVTIPESRLTYSPLITSTVFIRRDAFNSSPPHGVGVLIPRGEGFRMLGCLFNSSAFEGRTVGPGLISVTLMYGGTTDPEILNLSEESLNQLMIDETGQLLGLSSPPIHFETTRWNRAIPIYSHDLVHFLEQERKSTYASPGKVLFSNYSGQVSIRGMIETLQRL